MFPRRIFQVHGLSYLEIAVFPMSLPEASFPALSRFFAVSPFYRGGLCLTVRCISVPGFGACLALLFEIRIGSLCVSAPLAVYFGKYREGYMAVITVVSACTASSYLTFRHPNTRFSMSSEAFISDRKSIPSIPSAFVGM